MLKRQKSSYWFPVQVGGIEISEKLLYETSIWLNTNIVFVNKSL